MATLTIDERDVDRASGHKLVWTYLEQTELHAVTLVCVDPYDFIECHSTPNGLEAREWFQHPFAGTFQRTPFAH